MLKSTATAAMQDITPDGRLGANGGLSLGYGVPDLTAKETLLSQAFVRMRAVYKINQIFNNPNVWVAERKATYDYNPDRNSLENLLWGDCSFTIEPKYERAIADVGSACDCENVQISILRGEMKKDIEDKLMEIRKNPQQQHNEIDSASKLALYVNACATLFVTTSCTVFPVLESVQPEPVDFLEGKEVAMNFQTAALDEPLPVLEPTEKQLQ